MYLVKMHKDYLSFRNSRKKASKLFDAFCVLCIYHLHLYYLFLLLSSSPLSEKILSKDNPTAVMPLI